MENSTGTVWVIEDDQVIRDGISRSLMIYGLEVRAYKDSESFLDEYDPEQPGCLVIDYWLPEMNGGELYSELQSQGISIPAIFMSGSVRIKDVVQVMRLGAVDFLEKPFTLDSLYEKVLIAIEADRRLRTDGSRLVSVKDRIDSLTPREKEVMDLVVEGYQTKMIARRLDISHKTVEVHRSNITKRMKVKSVVDLVRLVTEFRLKDARGPHFDRFVNTTSNANCVQQ